MFFKLISDRHLTEKRSSQEIRDEIKHHQAARHAAPELHPDPREAARQQADRDEGSHA
jgi:hypothetical protein